MIIHSLVPLRICNKKGTFRVLNGFSHLQTSTNKITIVKNQKNPFKTLNVPFLLQIRSGTKE
jgi:hypothetical protein